MKISFTGFWFLGLFGTLVVLERVNLPKRESSFGQRLLTAAREYLQEKPTYDLSRRYRKIGFPKGDIRRNKGVCADLVIRVYREVGIDLQERMHEDMKKNFHIYLARRNYGASQPDPNIDHRRVPNLVTFLSRHGLTLTPSLSPERLACWQPGDIIITDYRREGYETHIGFVSDKRNSQGVPYIIHHRPVYPVEEDSLAARPILGHYRYPKTE